MVGPANSINESVTGITGFTGTAFTGTPVTQYNTLVGGATSSTIVNVAPSATVGVPLVSQGSAANPSFSTAVVAGGGTGVVSTTAYGVICGGTTSTGNFQNAGAGTAGQVLTSNGAAAVPSFQTNAAIKSVVVQTFTASGTYTPTTGTAFAICEICGGGGGGGGAAAATTTTARGSGGGGGGGYARRLVDAATIGASKTVTIGTGGAGGNTSGTDGSVGGNSSINFSTSLAANGGSGGQGSTNSQGNGTTLSVGNGGIGGTASGGDLNIPGGGGTSSIAIVLTTDRMSIRGGGGPSFFGSSPPWATSINSVLGDGGNNYGSGGQGGVTTSTDSRTGGAGSSGFCIITEFII
jgi:hypothetical protein